MRATDDTVAGDECSNGGVYDLCASPDDCFSGYCVLDHCTTGADGERCEDGSDCRSGLCVSYTCTTASLGSNCESTADCGVSLHCDRPEEYFNGLCTNGALDSPCYLDGSCEEGLMCSDDTKWPPGFLGTLSTCQTEDKCYYESNHCPHVGTACMRTAEGEYCLPIGTGADLAPCEWDTECGSGTCADYGGGVRLCSVPETWGMRLVSFTALSRMDAGPRVVPKDLGVAANTHTTRMGSRSVLVEAPPPLSAGSTTTEPFWKPTGDARTEASPLAGATPGGARFATTTVRSSARATNSVREIRV